ncbi:MAG: DNA polymerase III subunit gamma/tau [Gemmataceae bacterium]|nr:DNA polymerase III subunit gamma/tau [Gemmataceae bacterium]
MAKKKPTDPMSESTPSPPVGEYTVLARRYRPQQLADLVGQEPVAQALINALQRGRVAHAYLFTGARGVGKTSTARILAKAINCVKGPTPTPCDECEICKAITTGEDTDVIEIDGASNNGIDNIRDLRSNVQFRPSRSRNKIYIIDEVHMLSTQAFNGLLKTLEEPPPHVKFIFATTEVQKIPITILSRCQRFDFGGISITGIMDRLREIVASEGMQADDEALEAIARRAGGSMRDGQSLLDQLLAFSGDRLTVDRVHQMLGTAHEDRVTAIAEAVLTKNAKLALEIVNDIVNAGQQLGELLDQLIEYWRDLMVVNAAGLSGQSVSVSSARRDVLQRHATSVSLDTILAGMDIFAAAKTRMRGSSHVRALFEMALVRMSMLADLVPIAQIAQLLAKEGGMIATPAKASVPSGGFARAPAPVTPEKKNVTTDSSSTPTGATVELNEQTFDGIWRQTVTHLGFAEQSELRRANVAISAPNALAFRVPRRYNTPGNLFIDSIRLGKIADRLSGMVGAACSLKVEWTDDGTDANAPVRSSSATAMGQQRQARAEMMKLPMVKRTTDVLGAQVIVFDEGFGTPVKTEPGEIPETTTEE